MKKAEITSTTLVAIILLILGFAVLLYVFYQLNWQGEINDQVCHTSVIMRATTPELPGAENFVPLKCRTSKFCFGGECKDFEDAKGVDSVKVKDVKAIDKFLADEVVRCWAMMGEGKVNLFTQYWAKEWGVGKVYPTCVICSRIAYGEKLDKNIDLEKINVDEYMKNYKAPGKSVSYYDYIIGENGKIEVDSFRGEKTPVSDDVLKQLGISREDLPSEDDFEVETYTEEPKSNQELAVVFTQISAPDYENVFEHTMTLALGVFGFSFVNKPGAFVQKIPTKVPYPSVPGESLSGAGKTVFKKSLTPFVKIVAVGAIIAGIAQYANVKHNQAVTAGYCGDISTGKASEGCSVVRIVNYDVSEINQYCSVIESVS